MKKLFTSESVTEGHPDKLCDYISDSILDAYLEQDPKSRVACECIAGKGLIVVAGEITSNANVNIEEIVRNTIKEIGYTNENIDISYSKCKVVTNISKQSADIALGVDESLEGKLLKAEDKEDKVEKNSDESELKDELEKNLYEKQVEDKLEEKLLKMENKKENTIASEGAGDQGMVFGFATDETENYMPMPILLVRRSRKIWTRLQI